MKVALCPFCVTDDRSRVGSPVPGGSILMTSAPMSARFMVANGAAIACVKSMTRMPSSAFMFPLRLCSPRTVGLPPHAILRLALPRPAARVTAIVALPQFQVVEGILPNVLELRILHLANRLRGHAH